MTRRSAIQSVAGAALAPQLMRGQSSRRPNILFLMTDDQRFDAMSCAGSQHLRTPNMDRLASEGMRFRQAFASDALCSPSRATIVTGLYSHTHGVTTNEGPHQRLRDDQVTFPMLLRQSGYYTAMLGKWHIASPPPGYDHWCILPGQGVYHDPIMIANGGRCQFRGYVDDIIADQTIEILKSRPKNKPFSIQCQFKAPHRSWEPALRYEKLYEGVTFPYPPTFDVGLENRPAAVRNTDMQLADMKDFDKRGVPASLPRAERKKFNYQAFLRNYYRVLNGVDENLGRILDFLDQNGLAENTLVIYTSDNGFFAGEYGMFDKRLMYEASIRIPMLVRYPAAVKAGRVDSDHMVLNNDVAHTVLDYGGVARPTWMEHHGESWRPILENKPVHWRDAWLYEYFEYPGPHCAGKMRGVRTNRWKLIHYIQNPQGHELFDLQNDPEEKRNLYDDPKYKPQVEELTARLEKFRDITNDTRAEDGTPTQACYSHDGGILTRR